MADILIVDDEEKICFAFEQFFTDMGHRTFIASSAEQAVEMMESSIPDILFLDIRLPGKSGLEVLEEVHGRFPEIVIVIMTAHGAMDHAVSAMQKGAYDYLIKPIDLDRVKELVERILRSKPVTPIDYSEEHLVQGAATSPTLIGKSPAIQDTFKMIGLLTTHDVPVLIEGESGVGKELAAQAIHYKSKRESDPFVAINCGAMPDNLLETELFGHERGAFTGAETQKIGKFEFAGKGTIFLDEIGDLAFPLQIKLLRVLQEKQIVRVGGLQPITVQARVIAATNKNLSQEVEKGSFRKDLYYRLQLITLKIPPLRERKEDIHVLVDYFIHRANLEFGKKIEGIEAFAMDRLMAHDWPGNVRELENVIKRASIICKRNTIGIHHLDISAPEKPSGKEKQVLAHIESTSRQWFKDTLPFAIHPDVQLLKMILDTVEKTLIEEALGLNHGNQVKASEHLGMNRATLRKKMKEYRIQGGE